MNPADLDAEIGAADASMNPGAESDTPVQGVMVEPDQRAEIAGLLGLAVAVLAPMFPSVAKIYDQPTIDAVAGVTADLAAKRGWNISGTRYKEEIAFFAVVAPISIRTYQAIADDLTPAEDDQAGPVPAPAAAPGQKPGAVSGATFTTSTDG